MKRLPHMALLMAALSSATFALTSAPLAAAGKHKSLFATPPPTTTPVDPQKLRCDSLNKGIAPHIETMKALKAQIDNERLRPSDLESIFVGNPNTSDTEAKLARERRTTEEIAAMLPGYNCPPFDIEAEFKKLMLPTPAPSASEKPHKGKFF